MDPDACYAAILDIMDRMEVLTNSAEDHHEELKNLRNELHDHCKDLLDWLYKGGYRPCQMTNGMTKNAAVFMLNALRQA